MLDSGATCSAISADLVAELGARVQQLPLTLRTFDAKSTATRDITSFSVTNLDESLEFKISNALVSTKLGTDRDCPPQQEITDRYPHLKGVHFNKLTNPAVRVILDAKMAVYWLPQEVRMGQPDQPVAMLSKLGWYLIGDDRGPNQRGQERETHSQKPRNETTSKQPLRDPETGSRYRKRAL